MVTCNSRDVDLMTWGPFIRLYQPLLMTNITKKYFITAFLCRKESKQQINENKKL